jgi:hypothetical protein
MADAVIVGGIRALVVIPGKSGLARDVFVNSFAFHKPGGSATTDGDRDAIGALLRDFYVTGATGINPLGSFLGQQVFRGTNNILVKTYDMGETPPRTPRLTAFTMPSMGTSTGPIPNEVALCGSFKAASQKGPRGRGRIYVGPLEGGAVVEADDYNIRPSTAVVASLRHAMTALKLATAETPYTWCVYSTFGPTHLHQVSDVWVDNEFDTMRKRGNRATTRVVG